MLQTALPDFKALQTLSVIQPPDLEALGLDVAPGK